MDDLLEEIQAIRNELADLRKAVKVLDKQQLPRPPHERPPGHEGFMYDFKMHLSDQILRQPARIRIEQRMAAIEQRVADLEARYDTNATLN